MNAEQILDAIGSIDDELLQDTDHVRRRPKRRPIRWIRMTSVAAAVVLLLVGSVVAVQQSGMFSYKSADMAVGYDDMNGSRAESYEEPSDDYELHTHQFSGTTDGEAIMVHSATVTVTAWKDGAILADVDPDSPLHENYRQVRILFDDTVDVCPNIGTRITEENCPIGTHILVYYTDMDVTKEPVTLHAKIITKPQGGS